MSSQSFISPDVSERLLVDVRAKKDLSFLSTDFVLYHANEQLRLNTKMRKAFADTTLDKLVKSKAYDDVVKYIRAKARTTYAVFQVPSLMQKRKTLLENAKLSDANLIGDILQTHLSTKERVGIYPQLFALIEQEVGNVNAVLDLACGLNPIAYYHYTQKCKTQYVANEISDLECEQLNAFFKNNSLPAIAVAFDVVRQTQQLTEAPFKQRFDVCFLLKTLDTLETQRLYVTYDVMKAINARCIIASFPINTVSGKKMARSEQIHWFEKMLGRLELQFTRHVLGGEVFYFCTQ